MTAAFNLSQFANNLNSSGQLDATDGLSGIIPVANGGTGLNTISSGQVLLGNGTSSVTSVAPGTSGNALISNGSTWQSGTIAKLSTASGSAPSYSARAWVNFNGTGTAAIRAGGNVSSVTNVSAGLYIVNFTTAMPDANYAPLGAGGINFAGQYVSVGFYNLTTSNMYCYVSNFGGTLTDTSEVYVAVLK
jgi:hypothetical protein